MDTRPDQTAPDESPAMIEVHLDEGTEPTELLPVALPMLALAGLLEGIEGPLAPVIYANLSGPAGPFVLSAIASALEAARELLRAERVRIVAVPEQPPATEGGTDAAVV